MDQAFGDLARDAYAQHGAWGVAALWLRILPDECTTALAEHIVALREWRAVAGAEFAAVGTQGISVGVGSTPMGRKMAVGLMVVAVAVVGIVAFPGLFGYQPAVVAAPGVVMYVATQPGWLDGIVKAQQDMADEVPSTYTLLGWSADGVLYYEETITATQVGRTWAYVPGAAQPQLVVAPVGIVPTVPAERETLLGLVRAQVSPPSAEPLTRPLAIHHDGLASPDGRWAAAVAKHVYGPEDVVVIAMQ